MDAKTILNPKGWLIGVGIVNILFSIMNYMMGGDVATTALEAEYGALSDRELAVATGYEEGWGIFGIPYGVLAIASGVLLSGSDRAKMALTAGLTFIGDLPCAGDHLERKRLRGSHGTSRPALCGSDCLDGLRITST